MTEFVHHPASRQPLGTVLVVFMLGVVAYATYGTLHDPTTTVLMMLLYVGYMASFLFPSSYRIDETGITLLRLGVRHTFAWPRFRRYTLHRGGIFLAPLGKRHAIDSVRGVYLVMDKSQQALLLPFLEAHLGA